ncbi:MAG: hypothetical protein HWE23_06490 [Rhodobacteraceae bacterium]|nr:hypothetical protein [Paracoccaceae bacterium]
MTTDKEPTGSKPTGAGTDSGAGPKTEKVSPQAAKTAPPKRAVTIDLEADKTRSKPAATQPTPSSAGAQAGATAKPSATPAAGSVKAPGAASAASQSKRASSAASAAAASTAASGNAKSGTDNTQKPAASSSDASSSKSDGPKPDSPKPESAKTASAVKAAAKPDNTDKSGKSAKSGAGVVAVTFAAIAGGVVVLGLAYGLHMAGFLKLEASPSETAALQAAQDKVAALESKLDELSASLTTPQEDLLKQISALEDKVSDLSKSAPGSIVAVVGRDLQALKASVADLQKTSGGEMATALEQRVASLETQLGVGEAADADGATQLTERVSGLETKTESLQTMLKTTSDAFDVLVEGQTAMVDGLTADVLSVDARVMALENRLGDANAQEIAALAVAVSSLKTSLDAGRGYQTELAAVQAVLPDDMDVSVLAAHARDGVTPLPQLVAEFPSVARGMFAKIVKPGETTDVLGNLLASAKAIMAVRGPGDEDGTGPEALLSRMEKSVQSGDLEAALTAYEQLPDPAKAVGADWADRASVRVAADKLTAEATSKVLAILSKSDG